MTVDQAERERENRIIKVAHLFLRKGSGGTATWDELFKTVFDSVPAKGTEKQRNDFENKRKEIKSIIAEVSMTFGVLIHPSFPPGSRESVHNLLADKDELGVFASRLKNHERLMTKNREIDERIKGIEDSESK